MMRLVVAGLAMGVAALAVDVSSSVTFTKDVLPILQKNCQSCHRPGQIGPMALLNYQETRPWAKAIKAAVATRKMPPWFADPKYGHFTNDRSLKQSEIETIATWADSGAPEGDPKDAAAPLKWTEEGWERKPDLVSQLPDYEVPAKGTVEWTNITIPGPFVKDTWVTSIELLPTAPGLIHHMCVWLKPHTPDVVYNQYEWLVIPRDERGFPLDGKAGFGGGGKSSTAIVANRMAGSEEVTTHEGRLVQQQGAAGAHLHCFFPGHQVTDFDMEDGALQVPAGTDILVNLHYTTSGMAAVDRVKVGFTVANHELKSKFAVLAVAAPRDPERFAIPPNDPNWTAPAGEVTFERDTELVWMSPHMHLRGKDMTATLIYPDGKTNILLSVPHYDFNWQLNYQTSVKVPKGSKLRIDAHFNNSTNNPYNPNPNATVPWGDQSWEEMMTMTFGVIVDKDVALTKILKGGLTTFGE